MANKYYAKWSILLVLWLDVVGCSDNSAVSTLTFEAKEAPFLVTIAAKGELKSTNEVVLNAPRSNSGALSLSWLAPENSVVKKGQVIAKFDGEQYLIKRDKAQLSFDKSSLTKTDTNRTLAVNESSILTQSQLLVEEIDMSERFSTEDLAVYSKNEVIEQLLNKDYLQAKNMFLQWSMNAQSAQGNAQLELLSLKGKAFSDQVAMFQEALQNLEVVASTDGLFIYAKNWRGEKVRAGQSLWSGSKIGSIPDLSDMKALVYVLETQASGVKVGQVVTLTLDAYPKQPVLGKVLKVASISASREKNNPVKYVEVEMSINKTQASIMRPGQKLEATIEVANIDSAISVPNQVLYQKEGEFWIYVQSGGDFIKRFVTIGQRSQTKSQVLTGLNVGEQIALVKPLKVIEHE